MSFLEELQWRGLLHQYTGGDELEKHLQTPGRVAYAGFDPSADSLTLGHLVPIMLLAHWQRAGHSPIALMGGGTGLIGDPSFKEAERSLLTAQQVEANIASQRPTFEHLLDFTGSNPALLVNNMDWLADLGFIEVLRDIGKHFSVNAMIQKDSVRERLHNREQGISYTEFSYMLLQGYDYLHLYREKNCTVQMSGSDQYGNIVGGIDLIRRYDGAQAFGITAPLMVTASGTKMGKTETGAIYLKRERTSPYAFYQYLINVDDRDVIGFLKRLTMLDRTTVDALAAEHEAAPQQRGAQQALARELTRMVHGDSDVREVEAASQALFSGDVRSLGENMLGDVFADVPHSQHDKGALAGGGLDPVELLIDTPLAKSKREARQLLTSNAVSINGERASLEQRVTAADLLHSKWILLRRGKKNWHATHWK